MPCDKLWLPDIVLYNRCLSISFAVLTNAEIFPLQTVCRRRLYQTAKCPRWNLFLPPAQTTTRWSTTERLQWSSRTDLCSGRPPPSFGPPARWVLSFFLDLVPFFASFSKEEIVIAPHPWYHDWNRIKQGVLKKMHPEFVLTLSLRKKRQKEHSSEMVWQRKGYPDGKFQKGAFLGHPVFRVFQPNKFAFNIFCIIFFTLSYCRWRWRTFRLTTKRAT